VELLLATGMIFTLLTQRINNAEQNPQTVDKTHHLSETARQHGRELVGCQLNRAVPDMQGTSMARAAEHIPSAQQRLSARRKAHSLR